MSASSDPATCPEGHDDTVRLLNLGGVTGRAQAPTEEEGGLGVGIVAVEERPERLRHVLRPLDHQPERHTPAIEPVKRREMRA